MVHPSVPTSWIFISVRSIRLVRLRIAAVSNTKFELSCKSGGKSEHKLDIAGG